MEKPFVTVVIPVWNGASVILDTLHALYSNTDFDSFELICVDNASSDNSVELIQTHFPQANLLQQPVNLGFAGGVNVGIRVAQGEIIVLLNQDCLVESGWLDALLTGLAANPNFGVAGCTILNPDGSINHAGAKVTMPLLHGQHFTEIYSTQPAAFEYVTGALFAIRRSTIDSIGLFDEGFYPAYYEEADYCFRVRAKGLEVGYIPGCRAHHLFSGREWRENPLRYTADQHYSRYRFAVKHLTNGQLGEFFAAESEAINQEIYFEHALGRVLAVRRIFLDLPLIFRSCELDLQTLLSSPQQRHIRLKFAQILQVSMQVALRMLNWDGTKPEDELTSDSHPTDLAPAFEVELETTAQTSPSHSEPLSGAISETVDTIPLQSQALELLVEQSHGLGQGNGQPFSSLGQRVDAAALHDATEELLTKIYFSPQLHPERVKQRQKLGPEKLLQVASLFSGRDYWLHRKLVYNSILRLEEDNNSINRLEAYVNDALQHISQIEQDAGHLAQDARHHEKSIVALRERLEQDEQYIRELHEQLRQRDQSMTLLAGQISLLEEQRRQDAHRIALLERQMDLFVKMISYEGR